MAIIADIETGSYSVKELCRKHPDMSVCTVERLCRENNHFEWRKRAREAFFAANRDVVRRMWADDLTDAKISAATGIPTREVTAIRRRFGFLIDKTGNVNMKRIMVQKLVEEGYDNEQIAAMVSAEIGEPVSPNSVRDIRYRYNILDKPKPPLRYNKDLLAALKVFFYDNIDDSDEVIAQKSGVARPTVSKYRKHLLKELIEKEKAAL